jgi:fermentation-respiration switch protein FrsA (DUF1100 family)
MRLRAAGLHLLAFDYRGYESEGAPSEAGLYTDAESAQWFSAIRSTCRRSASSSSATLGSAVAVELADGCPPLAYPRRGLTSVPDRAQEIYPFFPVRWLGTSRYASREKIGPSGCPSLFLHAERDEVIPIPMGAGSRRRA